MHWPIGRVKVAEHSMEPALRPGDWLLVRRTRRIRPGQVVLARHPGRPEMLIEARDRWRLRELKVGSMGRSAFSKANSRLPLTLVHR